MTEFRLRPLHRQRKPRRSRVRVLNQEELGTLFGVPADQVRAELEARGIAWHEDGAGRLWASAPPDLVP